jgi:hypothetical protein
VQRQETGRFQIATVLDEYFDEFEEHCDVLVWSLFNIADSQEFSCLL